MGCDTRVEVEYKSADSLNPRTRVGCDLIGDIDLDMGFEFQSTHPCGVRRSILLSSDSFRGFNPRTRVGCDKRLPTIHAYHLFQSTHPCGVRPQGIMDIADNLVSIHAPVWGATGCFW